jgi:hypothetical protein
MKTRLNKSLILSALIAAMPVAALADATTVDWYNNNATLFRDASNNPLTAGNANLNGDGAPVEIGYYSASTTANNFAGTWVPLSLTTTVGDTAGEVGGLAGRIEFTTFFTLGSANVEHYVNGLDDGFFADTLSAPISASNPSTTNVLSIRFYNAAETQFNVVSSDSWVWVAPTFAGSNLLLDVTSASLEWLDAANAFKTTVPVPEPTAFALVGGALALAALRRRR